MEQQDDETMAQFVTRLKQVVKDCDCGDQSDNQIRDQVVQRCKSHALWRKLLEKGENLTLALLLKTAATYEAVQSQLASMERGQHTVNLIRDSRREAQQRKGKDPGKESKEAYYRCGKVGHYGHDPNCPARGKTCKKCGGANHFAQQCKTKSPKPVKPRSSGKLKDTKKKVRYVQDVDEDEDEYAFIVKSATQPGKIEVFIGGILVEMVVDSGASANVIDKHLWSKLKHEKIELDQTPSLATGLATFSALSKVGKTVVKAEFVVIDGKGEALLGRETAIQLGVLQFGVPVYSLKSKEEILHDYKGIFEGVGKLTGLQVKLHVDPEVPAVAQPVRRTPFSLREKVKEKIEELVAMDIIEPVEGPTRWVSPVVKVPKQNDKICLCVDMRRTNKAIIRERYQIPTVDEVLHNLNQSTVFSKLDLKWGYHQLELHPDSRSITTFMTHCGLYQDKRLMFGINSAPEVYQHVIQQTLQGCEGVANISDDIIVHGRSTEEHNKRLQQVLERLKEKNLTLNAEK
ncbi:uncharacterized protein K02A2.6-like [Acropora millepora]|uniref:uncharacterized protein K02A2.6-like n=1 Tax=Acropora millepora TaxID=45264 RepID=UPI001CF4BE66|nr:uncharacterized protein K02A2.6-like [Acropora millepora]